MGDPSVVCQSLSGTADSNGGCVLSPADEHADLRDWETLLNFRPLAVKDVIKQRFPDNPDPGYHAIEDAYGPLNLDFYPIQIVKNPVIGGTEIQPDAIVRYIRTHINDFVDPSCSKFNPYDPAIDGPKWGSDSPVGAVFNISVVPWLSVFSDWAGGAGVITAEYKFAQDTSSYWIFSCLHTPNTYDHPVSGNRQFGCAVLKAGDTLSPVYQKAGVAFANADQDAAYIFTRGADRCTTPKAYHASDSVFAGAHALWLSFQQKVAAYIVANGGAAFVPGFVSERWDWDEIKKNSTASGSGLWHDPPR